MLRGRGPSKYLGQCETTVGLRHQTDRSRLRPSERLHREDYREIRVSPPGLSPRLPRRPILRASPSILNKLGEYRHPRLRAKMSAERLQLNSRYHPVTAVAPPPGC